MKRRYTVARYFNEHSEGWYVLDRQGYEAKPVLCKTRALARDIARSKEYLSNITEIVDYDLMTLTKEYNG